MTERQDWICLIEDMRAYKCDICVVNEDRECLTCALYHYCYPKE